MALPSNADMPNYPFPAVARTYDFEFLRMLIQALGSNDAMEGIAGASTDLAVSITSGLTLGAAAGRAFVKGDDRSTQGSYLVYVPSAQAVTLDAHHATLPRIDRVVLRVYDADVSGAQTKWAVEKVTGTATAGASLTNLTGAAAVPNGALLLANVLVPATSGAVTLQDRRYGVPIAGRELFGGYTATTSNVVTATTTLTSAITHTVIGNGVSPVLVEGSCIALATSGGAGTGIATRIYDGTTAGTQLQETDFTSQSAGAFSGPTIARVRVPAFSGSKQFTWAVVSTAGTCTFYASGTAPSFLRTTWAG